MVAKIEGLLTDTEDYSPHRSYSIITQFLHYNWDPVLIHLEEGGSACVHSKGTVDSIFCLYINFIVSESELHENPQSYRNVLGM